MTASTRPAEPGRDPARGWKVLFVASIAVFLAALDVTIVNIALAACLLTSGRLADRFGRRRIFFVGIWPAEQRLTGR